MRMNRFEWLALCRDAKALRKTFSAAKAEAVFAAAMSTSHGRTAGELLFPPNPNPETLNPTPALPLPLPLSLPLS